MRSDLSRFRAWQPLLVGIAVAVAVLAAAAPVLHHGLHEFFGGSDPRFFLEIARSPFGNGDALARFGGPFEASYRYGRVGYPFLGWLLALGHPPWVMFTMATLDLAAIVAIPILSMALLDAYGAGPLGGALTAFVPVLYLLATRAYADAPATALLLLAFLLEARGRPRSAKGVVAYAVLVRETAALASVAMFVRAARRHDRRDAIGWALTLVPYLAWTTWVRFRVGEFPFLANDPSRKNALSLPFVGLVDAWREGSQQSKALVLFVILTAVLGVLAAWSARTLPIAGPTAAFALFALCTGPATLGYRGDTQRVLIIAQVFAIICVVYSRTTRHEPTADAVAREPQLQVS